MTNIISIYLFQVLDADVEKNLQDPTELMMRMAPVSIFILLLYKRTVKDNIKCFYFF